MNRAAFLRAWLAALAALIPHLAHAGVPLADVADVGPIATWEHPTTFAFHDRVNRLIEFRANSAPVLRSRICYIRQAYDGSASGGGGNGQSPQTAWKCRNMSDVRALVGAQMSENTSMLFRQGDTFYAALTNSPQGIPTFTFGHYTIGSYLDPDQPSLAKPRLLGFVPVNPADIQNTSGFTFRAHVPCDVFWVRARRSATDLVWGYRASPYYKNAYADLVPSVERTWAQDANLNVYFNTGSAADADDLGSIEAAVAFGPGIMVGPVDDVRLDNLVVEGWGMDLPEGGDGSIRCNQQADQTIIVTRCEWGWTAYHGLLHVSPTTGGIVFVQDCTFGFHVNRDAAFSGGGDGLVSYAPGGGNELILDHCRSFGGGLSRIGVLAADGDALGMPVYQHALAGAAIGLHLRRDCTFVPIHSTRAHYADYAAAADCATTLSGIATPFPQDPLDIRCYRAFVIGETADFQGSQFGGTWRAVDINCRWTTHTKPANGGTFLYWGATRDSFCGLSINRDVSILFDPAFRAHYALGEATVMHNHLIVGGRFRLIGGPANMPADAFMCEVNPSLLATSRLYNTVVSNQTPTQSPRWNYPNQSALTSPGGMAHCAFFGVPPSNFDATAAPVTLGAAADYTIDAAGAAHVPTPLLNAGTATFAGSLRLEYDALMRPRPAFPTIGPLEGQPACLADFNGDFAVDLFDYLDFLFALATSDQHADFNQDGTLDFFDYLDFLQAFSAGC